MRKKCYRFFGGLLNAQASWLNRMSEKGYHLVQTGKFYMNLKNAILMKWYTAWSLSAKSQKKAQKIIPVF